MLRIVMFGDLACTTVVTCEDEKQVGSDRAFAQIAAVRSEYQAGMFGLLLSHCRALDLPVFAAGTIGTDPYATYVTTAVGRLKNVAFVPVVDAKDTLVEWVLDSVNGMKVIRIGSQQPVGLSASQELIGLLSSLPVDGYDRTIFLFVDYGYGTITPELVTHVRELATRQGHAMWVMTDRSCVLPQYSGFSMLLTTTETAAEALMTVVHPAMVVGPQSEKYATSAGLLATTANIPTIVLLSPDMQCFTYSYLHAEVFEPTTLPRWGFGRLEALTAGLLHGVSQSLTFAESMRIGIAAIEQVASHRGFVSLDALQLDATTRRRKGSIVYSEAELCQHFRQSQHKEPIAVIVQQSYLCTEDATLVNWVSAKGYIVVVLSLDNDTTISQLRDVSAVAVVSRDSLGKTLRRLRPTFLVNDATRYGEAAVLGADAVATHGGEILHYRA